MSYEIESKSDLFTGASLTVRIPEEELDRKALHTVQTDKPDFILPFRSRHIDGQVEFVYQVGANSKLQYLSGERLPKEYAELWTSLLKPLLDCGDWFMNPYSFVLSVEQLYFNKNNKTVSYVYIPTKKGCSGYMQLKEMAADVSKLISVSDADLENKVLRAIMKDFNPADFLRMLKSYAATNAQAATTWPGAAYGQHQPMPGAANVQYQPMPGASNGQHQPMPGAASGQHQPMPGAASGQHQPMPRAASGQHQPMPGAANVQYQPAPGAASSQHQPAPGAANSQQYRPIIITSTDTPAGGFSERPQLPATRQPGAKPYESASTDPGDITINIPANGKPAKKTKEKEKKQKATSSKKENGKKKSKSPGNPTNRKKSGKQETSTGYVYAPQPDCKPAKNAAQAYAPPPDPIDITQCVPTEPCGARLRLVGSAMLPQVIGVRMADGEFFTIGRFDAAIGRKQSSFEFDKKTKAVSRRHAVIERLAGGYNIIDLSSSAGTFLNGDKLPPNAPCELSNGSKVSFGNAGADYIWESA